jgi:hypothetical protein
MFTLSVVLGSSILYKDFDAATPARVAKFITGCASTFIGVYLITSKRPQPSPHHSRNTQHTSAEEPLESSPLIIVPGPPADPDQLTETPPSLLGTSFGYHFTTRAVGRKGSRSTLPRGRKGSQRDDLARQVWGRWMDRGEELERTQSEVGPGCERAVSLDTDARSDIVNGRGSWNRARGNSVV